MAEDHDSVLALICCPAAVLAGDFPHGKECDAPGDSVARVAMSHGIETNVGHGCLGRPICSAAGGEQGQDIVPPPCVHE